MITVHEFTLIMIQSLTTLILFSIVNFLYNKYRVTASIKAWNKMLNAVKPTSSFNKNTDNETKLH
jgi:hypothetical protein